MKTPRRVNISISTKKLNRTESKFFRSYTQARNCDANKIKIVIGEQDAQGLNFVENLFHEFIHAYVIIAQKRLMSMDNEERLAQIVGQTVRGVVSGFEASEYSVKGNRRYQTYKKKQWLKRNKK